MGYSKAILLFKKQKIGLVFLFPYLQLDITFDSAWGCFSSLSFCTSQHGLWYKIVVGVKYKIQFPQAWLNFLFLDYHFVFLFYVFGSVHLTCYLVITFQRSLYSIYKMTVFES